VAGGFCLFLKLIIRGVSREKTGVSPVAPVLEYKRSSLQPEFTLCT
jgi:hypothetical protein